MLSFYDINTYNKIITAATTRFLGFVEGIESLLFVKPEGKRKTLVADPSKLLLIANTLQKYKPSASQGRKPIIQDLINLYANRCIHASLYVLYCVGKKCLQPSMSFCQSATTRNIGLFTHIATDLKTYRELKRSLVSKLQEFEISLIKSALQVREQTFNFDSINKLKNCVMKIADCNPVRPNNQFKRCSVQRNSKFLVCDKHRQKFDCEKLSAVSAYLPPNIDDMHHKINKFVANIKTHNRDTEFDSFFKEWVDYCQQDVFQLFEQLDDNNSKFVKCFFVIQALICVDWCHYKYVERVVPFFELGFFVPFAIMDETNGVQFAKNIVGFGRQEVIRQSARYVGQTTEDFLGHLQTNTENGYKGSFLICNHNLWSELKAFASEPKEKWLADYVSEEHLLLNWASDLVNCFSWTLIVEKANKTAKHVASQTTEHEETLNRQLFISWNQKNWLNHTAIDIHRKFSDKYPEFRLPPLRTTLSRDNRYSNTFPPITQSKWKELRKYVNQNRLTIRKTKSDEYCKLKSINLEDVTKEVQIDNTRKRKLATTYFAPNKVPHITFESECSDSDYISEDGYDEDIVYGALRELQKQDRRQYHVDEYKIGQSVIEEMKMDVSSAATDRENHNHNIHREENVIDSDEGLSSALEENYIYRASQRKRKPCMDYEQYLLQ